MNRNNPSAQPETTMPEIMRAVMPDFPKWNRLFFQLDCVFALISFFLTFLLLTFFWQENLVQGSIDTYAVLHMLLPALLNGIILLAAAILQRRLPQTDMRRNVIPVITMLLLNLVISMIPGVFFITLGIFCIPICMTTVYSNRKLCNLVTLASTGGVVLASVRHFIGAAAVQEQLLVFPQGLIAICILLTVRKVAHTTVKMTEGQKQKLIHYATGIKAEQQRAEAASEAKSLFLANMSHEIRTPINAILGMNEMILRENRNEQIEEYAKSIYSAGNSLLYLVNDVLDISKIESGRLEITENIYDLPSFIHDCYIMVAEKAETKGLTLTVLCEPSLPSRLKGDESRLRQIVTNLLSNAVKYTEKGSITLSFSGGLKQEEQILLEIAVKDTGIGIKEADMDQLFTQFTRFDMDKNRNIEGSGLGLALVKRLTDLMQGTIDLKSVYGEGTSATVRIPQKVLDSEPVGDFHQKYLSTADQSQRYQQHFEAPDARILVVDDVAVNLKVITNLLKSTRIKVDTAISGRRCLEMAAQTAYDLIFMDYMMPEMNGEETFAEIKKMEHSPNQNTPVIMLTANAITGVREQFLEMGFVDYLSKPVNGDKLENMILKYLPEEKCHTKAAGEAADAPNDYPQALKKLAELYPKTDLVKGLTVCADSYEVYMDLLQTYAEHSQVAQMTEYFEKKNTYEYQVCVHGIKSSSLSIGFSQLADQALALEHAARESNWEFICANHASFADEYQLAVEAIKKALRL